MKPYQIRFKAGSSWVTWQRQGTDMESCLASAKKEIVAEYGGYYGILIEQTPPTYKEMQEAREAEKNKPCFWDLDPRTRRSCYSLR